MSKRILLSDAGGDRATGYVMSNKIVRWQEGYLCTWLDHKCQNRWAWVNPEAGQIIKTGTLGQPGVDNHCGAALTTTPEGTIHAVLGGHHNPLAHYRLEGSAENPVWRHLATIPQSATYPSLICDQQNGLHLTYRCQQTQYWTLNYVRYQVDQGWTEPVELVRAVKPGYIYWTNGLALGPEDELHLIFSHTREFESGALYYGASHLYSLNGGQTWLQYSDRHQAGSVANFDVADLARIEAVNEGGDASDFSPQRIESPEHRQAHETPGPLNYNYLQMLLSPPVVDDQGYPWVILHNGLTGSADLYHFQGQAWQPLPLGEVILAAFPETRIHQQSGLSRGRDGHMIAVLMLSPKDKPGWGATGTKLIRVNLSPEGTIVNFDLLAEVASDMAQWLPALEQWIWHRPLERPALLYTLGQNAGGFAQNKNELKTKVYFEKFDG